MQMLPGPDPCALLLAYLFDSKGGDLLIGTYSFIGMFQLQPLHAGGLSLQKYQERPAAGTALPNRPALQQQTTASCQQRMQETHVLRLVFIACLACSYPPPFAIPYAQQA